MILNSGEATQNKLKDNEISLIARCAWDIPAKNGVIICLEDKIVLKYFKIISGWLSLLTAGLLSAILYPKYFNKIKNKTEYNSELKSSDNIEISISDISLIDINKPKKLKLTKVIINLNNGDKKVI